MASPDGGAGHGLDARFAVAFATGFFTEYCGLSQFARDTAAELQHHRCFPCVVCEKAFPILTQDSSRNLGYPTSAAALAEQALEWARPLDHANTLAYTLTTGVCLTNICARQPRRVAQAAEEAALHAEKYSLAVFRVWTKIDLAWARIHLALQSDCDEFEAGLYAKERTGTGRFQPWQWSLAAELRLLVGQPQEANSCISRAFELLEAGDDVAFSSEIYRQRAQVLLQLNAANYDAAVADLLSSLEIAKKQEALSWQLRAARDLARLWGEAGDRRRAVDLLAPIHSRFSEGFETADLKESGILLSELAN